MPVYKQENSQEKRLGDMPSSEQKQIQLQARGMQFHLLGILFRLTNEYALFSFCPQMKKQSQLGLQGFRTGSREKQKNSLEFWIKCRC